MLIIPHIFNFILEKNRNKTKNEITEPHLPLLPPPQKGAECLSSGDFFFRRYDELMLQYIETYEGTGSKQNIRPRRFTNFEKTSFCILNLIERFTV